MARRAALLALGALSLGGLSAACSTTPPGPAIDTARISVQRAEDVEARRYAPQDLARARDGLSAAEAAAPKRSDWTDARRLAEKAAVDGEVAAARAGAVQLRRVIEQLKKSAKEAESGASIGAP